MSATSGGAYSIPNSSPNPYNRRPLLLRKSPSRSGRGNNVEVGPSTGSPASSGVWFAGCEHDFGLSSFNPPRSPSPNKRPWYPAGHSDSARLEDFDEEGRAVVGSGRTGSTTGDGAYVIHPQYRHMFEEAESSERLKYDSQRREADKFGGRDHVNDNSTGGVCSTRRQRFANEQQQGEYSTGYAEGRNRREGASERAPHEVYLTEHGGDLRNDPRKIRQYPSTRGSHEQGNLRVNLRRATVQYSRPSQEKTTAVAMNDVDDKRKNPTRNLGAIAVNERLQKDNGRRKMWIESRGQEPVGGTTASTTGTHRRASRGSTILSGHEGYVMSLTLHEDVMFSSASDGMVKAWDTQNRECLASYEGHRRAVWGIQATGKTLVTGGADGTVRFWDIETTQPLHVIDLHLPVRAVAIVGDFLAVATSSPDIQLVDLDGMKRRRTLQGHLLAVSALASLDGGKRLVSGSHDTFIRVWNLCTGLCEATLGGHSGTVGAISTIMPPLSEDKEALLNAPEQAFDREALVISGAGDAVVRVWGRNDREDRGWTCRAVLEGHRHGVWAVHASSKLGIFATGGGDTTVKVWASTFDPFSEESIGVSSRELEQDGIGSRRTWGQGWECVGGVRGTIGAVGAVLITNEELKFGTSEAMIASFPLGSCMPV